jgi:ABC-2 type transport system permease protein
VGSAVFWFRIGSQDLVKIKHDPDEFLILNDIMQLPLLTMISCFHLFYRRLLFYTPQFIQPWVQQWIAIETDTQQFMLPVILPLILSM